MDERLHILGIRHHGPGSAASVERALDDLDPEVVLIEGPSDASDLIEFASTPGMRPPVALLLYPKGYPEAARFFPFAEFSPEWCAMLWATKHGRSVEFIDLPTQASVVEDIESARANAQKDRDAAENTLEVLEEDREEEQEEERAEERAEDRDETPEDKREQGAVNNENDSVDDDSQRLSEQEEELRRDEDVEHGELTQQAYIAADPLNALASVAGYSDGESWWNAIVEQSVQSPVVFDSICAVMAELRTQFSVDKEAFDNDREEHENDLGEDSAESQRENQREAHMRMRIRNALKTQKGSVAVVCGAWHAPALKELGKFTIKADKLTLKSTKSTPCNRCWIPWTDQRLASESGYRAGVVSPGWYRHLWSQHKTAESETVETARWQSRVASLLREEGYDASTASVIEASRLTRSLAAVRDLPAPGLIEMQDASLAALCHGEPAPLKIINSKLVIGNTVGAVDESVPQPPLLIDLAQQQKKLRIKPEALGREVKLDLRSVSGMAKSELLHRLIILDVAWGQLTDGQAGRGTFREVWYLQWQPEHAVALSEAVAYGPTVELASAAYAVAKAEELTEAGALADLLRQCLLANLPDAVRLAIRRLQSIAATSAEVNCLMSVLPPLADIKRYGTAREMPTEELASLIKCIGVEVNSGYRYACQQLDSEAAQKMRRLTRAYDRALELVADDYLNSNWHNCLGQVIDDERAAALVKGLAARLLHNKQHVDVGQTAARLSRNLAPAVPVLDAGDWLEGFIDESGEVFLHDDELFYVVDAWLQETPEESFIEILPMMRRSFSGFDSVLRRRLMQKLQSAPSLGRPPGYELQRNESTIGVAAFEKLLPLLNKLVKVPE